MLRCQINCRMGFSPEPTPLFIATKVALTKNSAHWRVVPLHDRKFLLTRGSPSRKEKFSAHKKVRHPEQNQNKSFFLTGGRGSCRTVISAGRQIGGLTVGSVGALSPTAVKLQNNRRPQGATLQKFSAISNCRRLYKWRRYHQFTGRVTRVVGRGQATWQVGNLAGRDVGRKFRLTRMFAL